MSKLLGEKKANQQERWETKILPLLLIKLILAKVAYIWIRKANGHSPTNTQN